MGRPVRGSRQSSFYSGDPNPSLSNLDSAFQLQEYISLLVRLDPHDVDNIVALPGKKEADDLDLEKLQNAEDDRTSVDEACWIYEQLRRLAQDLTHPLITTLQQECTRQTCPEMKAGEWLYLCVAHGNSGAMEHCCAIDYIVHTLDSATALLNSPRAFPSRISIPSTSHRHFPSLARRLGRIFAHAYHHHRDAFESAEAESALYARFLALSRRFDLVPAEFLVIPPRSTGDAEADPPREQPVPLLARAGSEEPVSTPAPVHAPGASPRIGGRSRTDTMYLSGGYTVDGTGASPSPRRVPSPMAGTLLVEQRVEDVGEGEKDKDQSVAGMPDVSELAKVLVRDFAIVTPPPAAEEVEASSSTVDSSEEQELGVSSDGVDAVDELEAAPGDSTEEAAEGVEANEGVEEAEPAENADPHTSGDSAASLPADPSFMAPAALPEAEAEAASPTPIDTIPEESQMSADDVPNDTSDDTGDDDVHDEEAERAQPAANLKAQGEEHEAAGTGEEKPEEVTIGEVAEPTEAENVKDDVGE